MIRTYKIDNTVRAINVLNRVSDWNGGGTLTFDNLVMEKRNVFPEFSLQVEEPEVGGIVVKTTSEVKNWSEFEEGIAHTF